MGYPTQNAHSFLRISEGTGLASRFKVFLEFPFIIHTDVQRQKVKICMLVCAPKQAPLLFKILAPQAHIKKITHFSKCKIAKYEKLRTVEISVTHGNYKNLIKKYQLISTNNSNNNNNNNNNYYYYYYEIIRNALKLCGQLPLIKHVERSTFERIPMT
jgi:hypothetical protein